MPWYQVGYKHNVVGDLFHIDRSMVQRLFDKTKWLASNAENLRHESVDPDLPGLSQYAVGEWRILYSIDRGEQVVTIHLVGTGKDLYAGRAAQKKF